MADDEELNQQIRQLADAIRNMKGGGSDGKADAKVQKQLNALAKAAGVSTKELDRYTKGQDKNAKGSVKFANAVAGGADKVRSLGTAFASSAAQIRENQESFASLNPMIDQAGRVAGGMIKGVGGAADALVSAIPVVGGVVSGLTKAGTALAQMAAEIAVEIGKAVTKELDTASGAMRELGQAGALGSKGITGIYDQAISAGLSIKSFSKIAGDSAEGLAFAFGDSATGVAKFAKVSESMAPFQRGLLAMGIGAEKQNELTAKYIQLQARQGNLQGRTDADLAKGSKNYITQLTALSRLTGKSVDEQQKAMDEQMRNVRMAAAVADVQNRLGDEAAKNMKGTTAAITAMAPNVGKGLQDALSGNLGTQAAQEFQLAAGEMGAQAVDMLRNGKISQEEATAMITQGVKSQAKALGGPGGIGAIAGMGTAYDNVLGDMLAMGQRTTLTAEEMRKLGTAQTNLANTTDAGTQGLLDGQTNMREFNKETNRMAKDLLPEMGAAVSTLTKGMLLSMKEINKMIKMGPGAYAEMRTKEVASKTESTAKGMGIGGIAGGALGAVVGSLIGPVGTVLGAKLGAMAGMALGAWFSGPGTDDAAEKLSEKSIKNAQGMQARALGGPVAAGQPYMVGEKGPELFSPKTNGTIIPNNQIKPASELTAADIPKLLAELKGYDVSRDDAGMWSAAKKSDDGTSETINQFGTKTVSGGFGSITYDAKGNEISRSTPKLGGLQMSSYADGSTKESLDFTNGNVKGKMEAVNGQGSKLSVGSGPFQAHTGLGGTGMSYDIKPGDTRTVDMAGPKGGYDSLKDGDTMKGMMDTITNVFAGNALGDAKDPGQQTNNEEMIVLLRELVSSQNRQVDTSDKLLQATYNN